MSSGRMYQKPGKLTEKGAAELQFKVPGIPTLRSCKPGKKVWVDRNQSNLGMFVVWINNKEYAQCAGEVLHEHVIFDNP
jgi:hypothetical protein